MSKGLCSACGVVLTPDNSSVNRVTHGGPCRLCTNERARIRYRNNLGVAEKQNVENYRNRYRDRINKHHADYHKKKVKDDPSYWQRRYHKMSKEEYDIKLLVQDNKCAICKQSFGKPFIDHDHKTGKNRDLLCRLCNLVLGHAREEIYILIRAAEYLSKHGRSNEKTP